MQLISERADRFSHALAEISGQTLENALDSFRGEADAGQARDGAGGQAGSVVEPEDAAIAVPIGPGEA